MIASLRTAAATAHSLAAWRHSNMAAAPPQSGKVMKNHQNFVKLTKFSDVYNSLTNFHKETNAMTGNGNHVNLLKKLVKSLHVNLFLAGFRPFEPLFGGGGTAAAESSLRQKSIESVARFQLLTAPPQHIPHR
jgi:hypothetical protein